MASMSDNANVKNFMAAVSKDPQNESEIDVIFRSLDVNTVRYLLCNSAMTGNLNVVIHLCKRNADITKLGKIMILSAANTGNNEIVDYLLDNIDKIDIGSGNGSSMSLLGMVSYAGHTNIVTKLLSHPKCKLNQKEDVLGGQTPLSLAVWGGHLQIVKDLLDAGANHEFVDSTGSNLVDISVRSRNLDMISHILSLGLNINKTDQNGITPLMRVVSITPEPQNAVEIMRLLIDNGATLDINHFKKIKNPEIKTFLSSFAQ